MARRDLTVDGVQVAVHTSPGDGPPIVLVHGNSASAQAFRHQLDGKLGREFQLFAIDLPGHGDSADAADPQRSYSLPGFASVVLGVAEQLELAGAVYVGWSLGGHVLLKAAAELPAAGLVLFGTPPLASPADMERAFLPHPANAILFNEVYSEDEVRARAVALVRPGAEPPELYLRDLRRADGRFRTALLASIAAGRFANEVETVATLTIPVAVLHGAQDQAVNGDYIRGLAIPTLWRGAVQVISEAGHSPQWERPDEFDALVAAFVREVTAAG